MTTPTVTFASSYLNITATPTGPHGYDVHITKPGLNGRMDVQLALTSWGQVTATMFLSPFNEPLDPTATPGAYEVQDVHCPEFIHRDPIRIEGVAHSGQAFPELGDDGDWDVTITSWRRLDGHEPTDDSWVEIEEAIEDVLELVATPVALARLRLDDAEQEAAAAEARAQEAAAAAVAAKDKAQAARAALDALSQ